VRLQITQLQGEGAAAAAPPGRLVVSVPQASLSVTVSVPSQRGALAVGGPGRAPGLMVTSQAAPISLVVAPPGSIYGPRGPQGIQGPPGIPAQTFTYVQSTPSAEWVIVHNMDRFPQVSVLDSSGNAVEGDIDYIDANTVQLNFVAAFSGIAYLN
jgi:hypothetical protein